MTRGFQHDASGKGAGVIIYQMGLLFCEYQVCGDQQRRNAKHLCWNRARLEGDATMPEGWTVTPGGKHYCPNHRAALRATETERETGEG